VREYVVVLGPPGGRVFVDGGDTGETCTVIFVETGPHIFSLSEDIASIPNEKVNVHDTSDLKPLEISLVVTAAAPDTQGVSRRKKKSRKKKT
jgi:hypothetical protein